MLERIEAAAKISKRVRALRRREIVFKSLQPDIISQPVSQPMLGSESNGRIWTTTLRELRLKGGIRIGKRSFIISV